MLWMSEKLQEVYRKGEPRVRGDTSGMGQLGLCPHGEVTAASRVPPRACVCQLG